MGPHLNTAMPAGTITALTVQQHKPTRVSVFLDGAFAFGVSQELVRQWDLWVGRQLSVEDQAHLRAAEQLLTAQATALQYLVARPRTAHEVRQKLRRSGVPDQRVDQVITRLQNRGVLDDTAYAHAYLTSRLASRGYGPQRLRQELQQRGIGRALVEDAVQQDLAVGDVLAAARAQAARRWQRLARETDRAKRRQKLWAFLRRRGFPAAMVQQVLTEMAEEIAAGGEVELPLCLRTLRQCKGYHMKKAMLCVTLLLPVCLGLAMTVRAQEPTVSGDQEPQWRYVRLSASAPAIPIRIVGQDEPWERVVQDIQARLSPRLAGRAMRVGFYGHGAFVKPSEVLHALPFVAALGEAAAMDVMVFPHWRFPDTPPWLALPRYLLQAQLGQGLPHSVKDVGELMRGTARQFALEHRAATAHAAVRLAAGLSAFHRQHITPSLAAFSASALVLVRLGEIVEHGQLSDGRTHMPVAESVRQDISMHNVVTFGYPLPNGQVAPALRQRMRGTFINVVPAHCEQQWQGNFLLRGAVENLPVSWAPAHVDWPRLAPQGPEVAVLGALLGGQEPALALRRHAWSGQRREGDPLGRQLWEPLCAALQRFDPAGAFRVLD